MDVALVRGQINIGFLCCFVHLPHAYEKGKKMNEWMKPASVYEKGAQTMC